MHDYDLGEQMSKLVPSIGRYDRWAESFLMPVFRLVQGFFTGTSNANIMGLFWFASASGSYMVSKLRD